MKKMSNLQNENITTRSRLRPSDRAIAFLLTLIMLVTMMPYKSALANDDGGIAGIGIKNNVLTAQNGLQTDYKITFYKLIETAVPPQEEGGEITYTYSYQAQTLTSEMLLYDTAGNPVYLESDGSMRLNQGQTVNFLSSSPDNSVIKNYLINNQIARIVIQPTLKKSEGQKEIKIYEQYESSNGFSGSDSNIDNTHSPTGDPAKDDQLIAGGADIYKLQYSYDNTNNVFFLVDRDDYYIKSINLTPMVDFDVDVQWRDTNKGRPDNDEVTFTIERTDDTLADPVIYTKYTEADATRETETVDSNNVTYTI